MLRNAQMVSEYRCGFVPLVAVRTEEPLCCTQFMGTMCAVWKYCWVSLWPWNMCLPACLHAAIFRKCVGSVKTPFVFVRVPESGADPTIESDSGFNAMDMAVAMGHRNGMCRSQAQYFWKWDLECWQKKISTELGKILCLVSLSSTSDGGTPAEVAHGNQRISLKWFSFPVQF